MRIVVWQSAFLGDLVLAGNLVVNLLINFPNSELILVARPFAVELFKGLDRLKVIPLKKNLKGTWKVIKQLAGCQIAFGVQRGLRTSLSLFLAKIPTRVGFKNAELSLLYTHKAPHYWGIHEVERNQQLLKVLNLKVYTDRLFLPINWKTLERIEKKFNLRGEFVAVAPSANFEPKRWNEKYFAKLIELLMKEGFKVTLIGAKGRDQEVAQRVLSFLKEPKGVKNLVGKTTVEELVHLIYLARLVVANDSAPVHIAEAVGTPVITVYCATSPYYGFFPRRGVYLQPKGLKCHPCKPNPKECKFSSMECTQTVKPEEVYEKALYLLNKGLQKPSAIFLS
ncbi:MAG TPA: glycosyltransferase family 9 protein [Aquifex aeolicus]|nr:glycosyltransferase family 9 protein [Aquificales bacterium]HIQ25925.1 glycosyltransferase family 9 protein [Aquifex aeolicus]